MVAGAFLPGGNLGTEEVDEARAGCWILGAVLATEAAAPEGRDGAVPSGRGEAVDG